MRSYGLHARMNEVGEGGNSKREKEWKGLTSFQSYTMLEQHFSQRHLWTSVEKVTSRDFISPSKQEGQHSSIPQWPKMHNICITGGEGGKRNSKSLWGELVFWRGTGWREKCDHFNLTTCVRSFNTCTSLTVILLPLVWKPHTAGGPLHSHLLLVPRNRWVMWR